ncbi:MAG: hypothetical protein VYA30_15485 [Myxococcota bacterium]|nr:hypothetical protein [Myxococcota bacterium]
MKQTFGLILAFGALAGVGCGGEEDDCTGAVIEQSTTALQFGSLAIGGARNVQGDLSLPESRTVFLKNRCGAPLVVRKACLIENGHDGDANVAAFSREYEPGLDLPISVSPAKDTAIRLTFDVDTPNTDLSDNGEPDFNRSSLVVFYNASNSAAIAIPVCGRAIESVDEASAGSGPCELPNDFDASAIDESICGD